MGTNQVLRSLCNEAYRESSELARKRGKINKDTSPDPFFIKHIVSLKDEPVSLDNFTNFDPTVRTTAGFYTIKYEPMGNARRHKSFPFVIGQDLIRMRPIVSCYKHWKHICGYIPELAWIDRWCPMLTKDLFDMAAMHPGMSFYFSPDWVGYGKMIIAKANDMGIDIDNRPFVTYAAKSSVVKEIDRTHSLAKQRSYLDYDEQIQESNKLFANALEV